MTTIIAHRGARNLWAENSLQGFRNVLDVGGRAVEFDLHLGADGAILVIHDATLDRTTTAKGPVRHLTKTSRHDLCLIGPDGEIDEGVPLLSEVLEILAPVPGLRLLPEFKADETGFYDPALIEVTVDILRDYGLEARTTLHSFDIEVLRLLARVAPEFERMISVNADWAARQGGIVYVIEQVRDLVSVIAIEQDLLEAEFTRITALWPLERISVWTVNEPESIANWLARGPGYLTSDDPQLALAIQTTQVTA